MTRIPRPPDSQTESPYKIGEKGHPRPREESKIPRGDTSRHPIALPSPTPLDRHVPSRSGPTSARPSRVFRPTPSQPRAPRDRNPPRPPTSVRSVEMSAFTFNTTTNALAVRPATPTTARRATRVVAAATPASAPAATPRRAFLGSALGARSRRRPPPAPRSPSPSRKLRRRRWRGRRGCAPPRRRPRRRPQRVGVRGLRVPAQRGVQDAQLPHQAGRGAAQGGRIVRRRREKKDGRRRSRAEARGENAPRASSTWRPVVEKLYGITHTSKLSLRRARARAHWVPISAR